MTSAAVSQIDYAASDDAKTVADQRPTPTRYFLGLLLLAVAVGMTVVLVLGHFDATAMPGCGKGAGCAEAAASAFGKVPLGKLDPTGKLPADFVWPVSFLGFAYFVGLFVAWATCRGGVSKSFRWVVRFGVLVSLFFIGVIFTKKLICMYCLGAHVSNLLFWLMLETNKRQGRSPGWRPVGALAVMFLLASTGLGLADARAKADVQASQEAKLEETHDAITKALADQREKAEQARREAERKAAEEAERLKALNPDNAPGATTTDAKDEKDPNAKPWKGAFTGRYRLGPEKARVRVVMITDYQCPDCKLVEEHMMKWVKENDKDVSLSIKHFPMCKDCNPNFLNHNMHPNACWAARAAEAAGILGGNAGFWEMHDWLFEQSGSFTDATLPQAVQKMGYDYAEFTQVMTSQTTLDLVKSDINEATWLGLHFTPMVYINGVEVLGVFANNRRGPVIAAQAALAQKPERMGPEFDDPQPGAEKCVSDWEAQGVRRLPPDRTSWATGPDDAKVRIDIYADYQEPGSKECDAAIREWMKGKSGVRYNFRHFPVDESCNDVTSKTIFPKSCIGHRAAEAAGQLGGKDAYWKMHEYVYAHIDDLSVDGVVQQANAIGLDANAFAAKMNSPEVKAAIMEDASGAKPTKETTNMSQILLYRGGIPTVYVNDKVVPRWRLKDDVVITRILDKAYGK
ncbi:MAG: thioredoxin domain-containing protein [Phycisphaerales bacterium]|nr:thioredoxin domain-containing protein [Phycisphaerales bacterium]